eukprot:TRINITY_DN5776_c0_g3_i2.p1 TRINITY_DN5776_c0_g3~~TRINITY_DN5776_c0_g3_i2.p1  ORF type:complete len:150 (+),score=15.94 TRINITY_DN5776_c0_g3_i2:232-681(+)
MLKESCAQRPQDARQQRRGRGGSGGAQQNGAAVVNPFIDTENMKVNYQRLVRRHSEHLSQPEKCSCYNSFFLDEDISQYGLCVASKMVQEIGRVRIWQASLRNGVYRFDGHFINLDGSRDEPFNGHDMNIYFYEPMVFGAQSVPEIQKK